MEKKEQKESIEQPLEKEKDTGIELSGRNVKKAGGGKSGTAQVGTGNLSKPLKFNNPCSIARPTG